MGKCDGVIKRKYMRKVASLSYALQGSLYDLSWMTHDKLLGDSDVGDTVMLVTLWWWLISDIGGRTIMLATFFVMLVIFSMY